MDPAEYERMFQVEDVHWWYQGMQEITRAMLDRYIPDGNSQNILDAGCGTGAAMSTYLKKYGVVTGIDISALALSYSRKRNIKFLARGSVLTLPFKSNGFDLVTCFDVLYERAVTNDFTAVNEFFRVLNPGGYILLRLPAYDWLRGQHDITTHTSRRYTAKMTARLLKESGFQLAHITYANMLLFPLAFTRRMFEKIWHAEPGSSDLSVNFGIMNGFFKQILGSEAPIAARFSLPYGLSIIALGRKP